MNPHELKPWWLRKRFWMPVILLLGVTVAGLVAYNASQASTIVVYNETGHPLPPLLIKACGQERSFISVPERGSVLVKLADAGMESAVQLELATEPPWRWEGEAIKPRGGYRVSIRIWPDRQVEAFTDISVWQRLFE